MLYAYWAAVAVAGVDIFTSRLSLVARLLWILAVICIPWVGLISWILTRSSSRQDRDDPTAYWNRSGSADIAAIADPTS